MARAGIVAVMLALAATATAHADDDAADLPEVERSHAPWIKPWAGTTAIARAGARVSLTQGGVWLDTPLAEGERLPIHEQAMPNPRFEAEIRNDDGRIALALYVERAALETVTIPGAHVLPVGAHVTTRNLYATPGYHPFPGTIVSEELGVVAGRAEVKLGERWKGVRYEVHGTVEEFRISKVFPIDGGKPWPAFEPNVTLPSTFELLDRPGGKSFATCEASARVDAMRIKRSGKFTLVRLDQHLIGWIPTSQIRKRRPAEGDDDEISSLLPTAPVPTKGAGLAPGTKLYDAPSGNLIGAVRELYKAAPAKRRGDWARFDLKTRFGPISVWANHPRHSR